MATTAAAGVRQVAEVSSDTTVAPEDYLILVYTAGGPVTVTIPTAGLDMAYGYRIVDADGASETNNITVQAEGTETIERGGSSVGPATLAQNDGVWDLDPHKQAGGGNEEWSLSMVVQDHSQLQGVSSDQHHAEDHASRHAEGAADELQVEDLATASTTASEVPKASGAGGLAMGAVGFDELTGTEDAIGHTELDEDDYRDFEDMATPSDPPTNIARLWAEAEAGHTILHYKNSVGIDFEFFRDMFHIVRNNSGSTLSAGELVYVTGSNGTYPTVDLAQADDPATMPAEYILLEDLANNDFGVGMTRGDIESIDLSSFNEGDELFVSASTPGGLTATAPSGSDLRQTVGTVVKDTASGVLSFGTKFSFDPSLDFTWTGQQRFQTDIELDQQADDGSQRVVVKGSDGAEKAEIYFDGTDTVINPLSGDVKVPGSFATGSADITELFTAPAGVMLTKSSDESIANNTIVQPAWDSADEFNSAADAFADLANDRVTVPTAEYNRVRLSCQLWFNSAVDFDLFDIRFDDGSEFDGEGGIWNLTDSQSMFTSTAWVPANNGDSYSIRIRQTTGGAVDLKSNARTWFQIEAF